MSASAFDIDLRAKFAAFRSAAAWRIDPDMPMEASHESQAGDDSTIERRSRETSRIFRCGLWRAAFSHAANSQHQGQRREMAARRRPGFQRALAFGTSGGGYGPSSARARPVPAPDPGRESARPVAIAIRDGFVTAMFIFISPCAGHVRPWSIPLPKRGSGEIAPDAARLSPCVSSIGYVTRPARMAVVFAFGQGA